MTVKTGFMIHDRRKVQSIGALDVADPHMADMMSSLPLAQVDSRLDPYTPDPDSQDIPYDMKKLRLHFGEFLRQHSMAADSTSWTKQFKTLLPGVVKNATVMVMDDAPVATFRRDTKLAIKRLEKEQPHIIAKYTEMVTKPEFNEAKFKAEMPDVHAAYRGRSFRLTKTGPGAGLVLPS